MRVICIANQYEEQVYEELIIGEIYTVIDKTNCPCGCGEEGYKLSEIPTNKYWFWSRCFVLCSDIDNLQLTEEEAQAIRKRQLTPLKALMQHSLPKGYKLPQTFRN